MFPDKKCGMEQQEEGERGRRISLQNFFLKKKKKKKKKSKHRGYSREIGYRNNKMRKKQLIRIVQFFYIPVVCFIK